MKLEINLLILCHLFQHIYCDDPTTSKSEERTLDYYEFQFKHGDTINYEDMVKKIKSRNKSEEDPTYGTQWEDFTEATNILIDLPHEEEINKTTTKDPENEDPFNVRLYAKFLTFPPDNETTTNKQYEYITRDLTYFETMNWTFPTEDSFYAGLITTEGSTHTTVTEDPAQYVDTTGYEFIINANESFYKKYENMTSSEEREKLYLTDFYRFTVISTKPPSSTWNPFLIQSEERAEMDRIAKEKRMATNDAMRDQVLSGNNNGLGGLLGGMIPINLGSLGGLGNLMGNLKPMTITLTGGKTTKGKITTARSTRSTRTFKPRPNPQDFIAWKYLENGSPRPPMPEDQFLHIVGKYSTPFPYDIPTIAFPVNFSSDILDQLHNIHDTNATIKWEVNQAQRDRIFNFINPFIQQHTAMDLLEDNIDTKYKYTTPIIQKTEKHLTQHTQKHVPEKEHTTKPSAASRRTIATFIFTTEPPSNKTTEPWRANWSKTGSTIDVFADENMMKVLNEAHKGNYPWKSESFKTRPTPVYNEDPKVRALEKDFDNIYDKDAQMKRQEHAAKVLEDINKEKEKIRRKGITKPPYWKEVINTKIEPLFGEETSTVTKSFDVDNSDFQRVFELWKQGHFSITTNHQPTATTSTHKHIKHTNKIEDIPSIVTHKEKTAEEVSHKNTAANVKKQEKWTTPKEDKERVQSILSYMFPYIQKKSEIFETGLDKKSSSIGLPTMLETESTTKFDPWGSEIENLTPPPEFKKFFEMHPNQTDLKM